MGIQLKISNNLEKLAQSLGDDLESKGLSVFQPEMIITQTSGMNRWISIFLARHKGTFANFEFLRPNAFIDRVFRLAGMEKSGFYSPEFLKWPIYSILGSAEFSGRFKSIAAYYKEDELKKLQLASKMADLYDQYSIYRPDYIESWDRGQTPAELSGYARQSEWQKWLWQKLKNLFPDEREHDRVTQTSRLKELIKNDRGFIRSLKKEFPYVSVFGLSVITPLHVELFRLLSEHIRIIFYLVNPSPGEYWYDTRSEKQLAAITEQAGTDSGELLFEQGNALLTNYGKIIRDAFLMLFDEDTFNTLDESTVEPLPADTLLHKIQDDIFHNHTSLRNPISYKDLADGTVQVSSSYTEVRELEALHNYLLHLFEKEPALLPKDILVLTPDIDRYTPYITAVFNNVPIKNHIPYSIADRSYSGGDNIIGVIQLIMELSEESFTSERVVQLLDSAYVSQRYGISNIGLIRDMVRESSIRTGLTGEQKNDTNLVSWDYGIRRLILGYAMQGGDAFQMEDETYFPVEAMEGETARETLRFIGFVDDLIRSMKYRKNDKTLADWKNYLLEEVLQRFVFVRNENDREFKYVLNKLSILDEIAAAFSEKIPFEVFKKALNDLLFSETRSGEFITGAVTFSTMIPMRSIPFRVIAVLGLDNKKFPRTHVEPAFNLLSIQPRRGDRNIKDNDKHLFLETLLATRDHLYLSYRGNDIKDTNPLPPSLLIDELVGYIENSYTGEKKEVRDELVTKHPLHGFSPKYNTDHHLYSYDEVKTDDMARTGRSAEKGFEEDADTVTLDELIRFYRNPFKWYYNQILQVYYDEPEVLLPENELFELDNLQTYQLKHKLITCPDGYSIDGMIEKGKRTGELPLGNMSQVVFDRAQESVQSIREIFGRLTAGLDETAFSFALSMDGTRLNAQVDSVYGGVLIAFSLSDSDKKEPSRKYILEAWIKHLALAAAGTPKDTLFIWKHGEMVERIPGDMLSREEALTRLSLLVELYQKGRQQILPFDPAVSFNLVYKSTEVGKAFQYLKAIGETGFNKDYFDPYYQREIRQGFFDENNEKYTSRLDLFVAAAEAVWSPLRDHQSLFK